MKDNDCLKTIEKQKSRNPQLFKLAGYNLTTVHEKQMAFHACLKRNRWVFGGNRTGKTECGAVEAVWFARGIHPFRSISKPTKGWVVSLTQEVQRDVAQEKILSYLPKEWIEKIVMRRGREDSPDAGVIDFILVKCVHGGLSVIGFKSCDQGRQRFQGTSQDWIWFDEEPPEDMEDSRDAVNVNTEDGTLKRIGGFGPAVWGEGEEQILLRQLPTEISELFESRGSNADTAGYRNLYFAGADGHLYRFVYHHG